MNENRDWFWCCKWSYEHLYYPKRCSHEHSVTREEGTTPVTATA